MAKTTSPFIVLKAEGEGRGLKIGIAGSSLT